MINLKKIIIFSLFCFTTINIASAEDTNVDSETSNISTDSQISSESKTDADSLLDDNVEGQDLRRNLVAPLQQETALDQIMKIINDDYSYLEEVITDDGNIINLLNGYDLDNIAIIYTDIGNIVLKLFPDTAPKGVAAFKRLVRSGFYDGTGFFKLFPDYLIQAGDPTNSGYGGSGQKRKAEIAKNNPDRNFGRGSVAFSNQGNLESDDSQFFITFNAFTWLNGQYTMLGKVISGMYILDSIPASYSNDGLLDAPLLINKIMIASNVSEAAIQAEKERSMEQDSLNLENENTEESLDSENESENIAPEEEQAVNEDEETSEDKSIPTEDDKDLSYTPEELQLNAPRSGSSSSLYIGR